MDGGDWVPTVSNNSMEHVLLPRLGHEELQGRLLRCTHVSWSSHLVIFTSRAWLYWGTSRQLRAVMIFGCSPDTAADTPHSQIWDSDPFDNWANQATALYIDSVIGSEWMTFFHNLILLRTNFQVVWFIRICQIKWTGIQNFR